MASFLACIVMKDFDQGAEIARFGLVANPDDPTLMNNLIYSLANQNKLDEAEDKLQGVCARGMQSSDIVALTATEGLIRYRRGDVDRGRQLYMDAIQEADRSGIANYRAFAAIFLALEDLRANSPTIDATYELANVASKGIGEPAVRLTLNRLRDAFSRRDGRSEGEQSARLHEAPQPRVEIVHR